MDSETDEAADTEFDVEMNDFSGEKTKEPNKKQTKEKNKNKEETKQKNEEQNRKKSDEKKTKETNEEKNEKKNEEKKEKIEKKNEEKKEEKNEEISVKSLADIEALRQSLKTLNVWDIPLSRHLIGFQTAISRITTAVSNGDKKTTQLSLGDAAYVVYNAGAIWAKRVDEVCRLACRTTDILSSADGRKSNKETEDGDAKEKRQQRKKYLHPLTLPQNDTKNECCFLPQKNYPKKLLNRCIFLKEFPKLSEDFYLSEVQPKSLGLLDEEKIKSYLDDRGNKGNDWADFFLNTVKLKNEGFFPIAFLHPNFYEKNEIEIENENDIGNEMLVGTLPEPDNESFGGQLADDHAHSDDHTHFEVVPGGPAVGPPKPVAMSQGRPDRPTALPFMPFQKTLPISLLKTQRGLLHIDTGHHTNQEIEIAHFRPRTKRVLQKKVQRHASAEVEFFQNFWLLFEKNFPPKIRLMKVLRRFSQRLRRVQTIIPTDVTERGSGRGLKRKQQTEVTFVSDGECPFGQPDIPALNFFASGEKGRNPFEEEQDEEGNGAGDRNAYGGVAEYLETDEPITGDMGGVGDPSDPPLHHGVGMDFFGKMRAEGLFLRPHNGGDRNAYAHGVDKTAYDFDGQSGDNNGDDFNNTISSSQIGQVDLCDWENKLTDFLSIHERETLTFNLEECGWDIILQGEGRGRGTMANVVRRSTTGDVCRSFLSMLDLANKGRIEFEQDKTGRGDDEGGAGEGPYSLSQGADEMAFRITVQSSQLKQINIDRKKGGSTGPILDFNKV